MMQVKIPTRAEVTAENQQLFDQLSKQVGFVPNIYAAYAISPTALGRYLTFSNGGSKFSSKEKEAVNLVVSQINGCTYCQAAHSAIAKNFGFAPEEIMRFRQGSSSDSKFDALVKLAKSITINRGSASQDAIDLFFDAGYSEAHLVDLVVLVGERTMTNYLNKVVQVPLDFPAAPDFINP